MNKIWGMLIIGLLIHGCKDKSSENIITKERIEFNQELADELKIMAEVDQIAGWIPEGKYKDWPNEKWNSFKDSVFTTHQIRLKQIFDEYGFIGFDFAGEEGSRNFFFMVQHSDHVPEFQKMVLDKMKIEVDNNNASSGNYGLLVDRVRLNTGDKQLFGTQVTYNMETGQAHPRGMEDSLNVNERRVSIGLERIEEYLNRMTELHFEMNKENYLKKGVTEPKLYETKN